MSDGHSATDGPRSGQAGSGQAAGEIFDPTTTAAFVSSDVTRVTLVRHGEVERLRERVVRGQLDIALSEVGRAQGQALHAALQRGQRPTALISSDLRRCSEFALQLASGWQLDAQLRPEFREQSMGTWQGATWAEIQARHGSAVNDYWDDYANARPPEGESLRDLGARIERAFQQLLSEHAGGHVLLVTHIGVIRCLLCGALGLGLDQALRFAPATASVTELLLSESGAVVEVVGERPWLGSLALEAAATAPGGAPDSTLGGARRIALSGSAGAGKTRLGRALSAELGLPFIEEGMRARLESGLDLHELGFEGWRALSWELWNEQREREDAALRSAGGFVADRSSIDFAAFWLHYGLFEEAPETERYLEVMRSAAERYERVLLFPWGVLPPEADGVRSTNPWLQLRFQSIVESLQRRYAPPGSLHAVPPTSDFSKRMAFVRSVLTN